ncbi:DUF748 domain-containing protein [Marinobacter zhanjiangensis]|uniref:DUF748 domain-containing protein n=1 Tax=Marinobacter zhanjiangensis TaxID=578215 RepID=A0ABQ3AKI0_9GAMM|nr:DUF748 domain-containing protein [Marinobacter zhanjiangensis]GGY60190.1 hypothetical protein GCM10007071_03350 [Marinobacter zhanjiangensis]
MTETAQRKPAYRRWWFWLLVLGLVYLVTGFGLIPLYLSSAIPERFQQHLGWSAEVADVGFNPFTFSFSLEALSATGPSGEQVLEAQAIELNLGLFDLVRGTVHVEHLELDNPFLRVDLLENNRINLIEDWREQQSASDADPDTEEQAPFADNVVFDEVVINGGRLLFRDFTEDAEGESREFLIDSLELTLLDVTSRESAEAGEYSLQAVMDEQVLDWSGTLNLDPLWSNGRLALSNVSAETVQHWLGQYLPWSLQDGRISLTAAFQLAFDDQGLALATREGEVTARGLALTDPGQPESTLASAGNLSLNGVSFNLEGPELVVSRVQGEALHLNAVMGSDGQLNLTRPLQGPAAGEDGDAGGFRWSVGDLAVSGSTIDWQDNRPATPVQLALEDLELNLGAMTEQLEEPVSYQVRTSLDEGGSASANGQFTLHPLTFEGGINLDQVVLAPFNGYLQQFSQMDIRDGTLNLAGNIDIDVQDDPLTGTFSGRGSVSHFNGQLPDEPEPVVTWRELRLDPIEYNFTPARLEIGTMTVSEPELNVINYRDRPHNVTRLLQPAEATADDDQADTEQERQGIIFRLSRMDMANAEIRYTDQTPRPAFTSRLHDLTATVSGLSNVTPQQGQFSISGIVNDSGELRADGTIATLGTDDRSRFDVTLDGLSMPVISPYFGFYLGYRVDGGRLSADGTYNLYGSRLESDTTLVLDRLELGEAVQSDTSITAPVKLGLTLLRDSDDRVTLDISVNGNLADPEFNLGPVMMKTLRSVLVKAAMSPFSLLGSVVDLAGFSPDELGEVAFMPGETTLVMGEYTKMEKVAEALKVRDGLVLNIRGRAVESVDMPALEADLAEDESLQEGALDALAAQRGQSLKRLLTDEYGVTAEQIFLRAHEVQPGEGEADQVAIEFQLEAR